MFVHKNQLEESSGFRGCRGTRQERLYAFQRYVKERVVARRLPETEVATDRRPTEQRRSPDRRELLHDQQSRA